MKSYNGVRLFVTPWTVAHQAPPSMGFSKQEYWSGLPLPPPGDLPGPGIEPRSPALQADTLTSEPPGKPNGSRIYWLSKHLHFEMTVDTQIQNCQDQTHYPLFSKIFLSWLTYIPGNLAKFMDFIFYSFSLCCFTIVSLHVINIISEVSLKSKSSSLPML